MDKDGTPHKIHASNNNWRRMRKNSWQQWLWDTPENHGLYGKTSATNESDWSIKNQLS
jgi:SH3-like domain-containing protein